MDGKNKENLVFSYYFLEILMTYAFLEHGILLEVLSIAMWKKELKKKENLNEEY